jgi:hypothetical protein
MRTRALEAAGYVLRIRELTWYAHRMFKGPDTDINLHVILIRLSGNRPHACVPRLAA